MVRITVDLSDTDFKWVDYHVNTKENYCNMSDLLRDCIRRSKPTINKEYGFVQADVKA